MALPSTLPMQLILFVWPQDQQALNISLSGDAGIFPKDTLRLRTGSALQAFLSTGADAQFNAGGEELLLFAASTAQLRRDLAR